MVQKFLTNRVISNLLEKADAVVIGGGMANTFLAAQGKGIGSSLFEEEKLPLAKELLAKAEEKGVKVFLPAEVVVADKFAADANHKTVSVDEVPADWMILDNKFSKECQEALENEKQSYGMDLWVYSNLMHSLMVLKISLMQLLNLLVSALLVAVTPLLLLETGLSDKL